MKMILLLIAGLASACLAQETRPRSLERKVLDWYASVVSPTMDPVQKKKLEERLSNALKEGKNVALLFEGGPAGAEKLWYARTWAGEIFPFELTPLQAKNKGLHRGSTASWTSNGDENSSRFVPATIRLDNLKFEGGPLFPGSARINGSVAYKFTPGAARSPLTLRVAWQAEQSGRLSYTFVNDLKPEGIINLSIGPINEADGEVSFGPVPLHVDLLLGEDSRLAAIASNTLSVLLDVKPDLDAFARLGLDVLNQITDVLATVKDKASAAKAVDDYKRLMLRNQAVVEAMQRLAPTKEQDADIERRFGPQIDATGRRLGEQVTRLEQAEYAGEAFFLEVQKALQQKK